MKERSKRLQRLGAATAVLTVLGLVPQFAGTAFATTAVPATAITASPPSQTVNQGATVTITGTVTPATTTAQVELAVTSGPDSNSSQPDKAVSSCGTPPYTASSGAFTCTYTASATSTGQDDVLVYADNAGTNSFQSGDPSQSVTVTVVGPPYRITIAPGTNSAAQNTCSSNYTATVYDASGNPVPNATVNLSATQTATTSSSTEPVPSFCNTATVTNGTPKVNSPSSGENTTTSTATSTPTGQNGETTFGVDSDTVGTVNITSTSATVGSTTTTVPTTAPTATLTVNGGGANNVASNGLALSPSSQNAFNGKTVSVTYTLTNSAGNPVGGVPGGTGVTGPSNAITPGINGEITSGPSAGAAVTCTASSNGSGSTGNTMPAGEGTCSYTSSSTPTGTDTIEVWVNQSSGATSGPDPGEPQATATAALSAEPTNEKITSNCDTGCTLPLGTTSETVTFTNTATSSNTPQSGYVIDVTLSPTKNKNGAAYTLSADSCTTNSSGQCSVTVTNPSPSNGDKVTVTGTLSEDSTVTDASPTITWEAAAASSTTITPEAATNVVGATVTKTVTVDDQFGNPVSGDVVNWTVTGRNNTGNNPGATGSCTTSSAGQCTFTYTDKGSTTTANSGTTSGTGNEDIITAAPTTGASATAYQYWVVSGGTVQQLQAGVGSYGASHCGTFGSTSPYTPSGWTNTATGETENSTNSSGATNAPTNEGCVEVRDANGNPLYGQPISVSSSGVGTLTDSSGNVVGTSETINIGDGNNGTTAGEALFYAESAQAGTQTITFSANGVSQTVTIVYAGQFVPVTPTRLVDTRTAQGGLSTAAPTFGPGTAAPAGPLAPNTTYYYSLANQNVVPNNGTVRALVLNVTAIQPNTVGNLRVFPDTNCASGATVPTVSNINYVPGQTVANAVIVPIAPNCVNGTGDFAIYSANASVNVAIDITGYYLNGYEASGPTRVLDTRTGSGETQGLPSPLPANTTEAFSVTSGSAVPVGATAVIVNVTAVNPQTVGNLRVFPDGSTPNPPNASNINYVPGQDKAVLVIVQLPADGKVDVYSAGSTVDVTADVFGYLDSASTASNDCHYKAGCTATNAVLQTPVRILDTRPGATHIGTLDGPLAPDSTYTFQVAGLGNVPSNAQAVILSVTAVSPGAPGVGNLRVFPSDVSVPNASTINYIGSDTIANFAIIRLPGAGATSPSGGTATGTLSLYSAGSPVNVTVDVIGWVPAGS